METINIILGGLTALSGIGFGEILARTAKEELKKGKKYFYWMKKILLILIGIIILYSYGMNLYTLLSIGILWTLLMTKIYIKPLVAYIFLTAMFIISTKTVNLFIIINSLIFLYGLPTAGLRYK